MMVTDNRGYAKRVVGAERKSPFLVFFLSLAFCPSVFSAVCVDLKKTECVDKRNCIWVKGYDDSKGERVMGYCRKQAASSKSTKTTTRKKSGKKTDSSPCSDLLKADCEKKRNCGWVTGYTTDKGDHIQGYCRSEETGSKSSTEKAKKSPTTSGCQDIRKTDCERKRSCNWVKGYVNDKGERVKGYCRKKGSTSTSAGSGGKGLVSDIVRDVLKELLGAGK